MKVAANIASVYFGDPSGYKKVPNTDIMDHDLLDSGTHAWTQDVGQLMFLCDADPICIGLSGTEQGQLKCGVDRTAKTLTFSDAVKFK